MEFERDTIISCDTVAVLAYEALRQQSFPGLAGAGEMARER